MSDTLPASTFEPIGVVRTPFLEKFGTPRQPGLVEHRAFVDLDPRRVPTEALRGLEAASHVWVIFVFHQVPAHARKATVRPPRLGGNRRLGVLATRSPFRPNPIGISAVPLLGVEAHRLRLGGGDFVDGTPVLDVKPYVPYTDALPRATHAWAHRPEAIPVRWSEAAQEIVRTQPGWRALIEAALAADPRPAYHDQGREYGLSLQPCEVRFGSEPGGLRVLSVVPRSNGTDLP